MDRFNFGQTSGPCSNGSTVGGGVSEVGGSDPPTTSKLCPGHQQWLGWMSGQLVGTAFTVGMP
jgi:hypothetical protein